MNKKVKKYLIRNFNVPIIFTAINYFFLNEIHSFKEVTIFFCVTFTINWFFDKTIMQWSINQGKKFQKEKNIKTE